MAKLIVTIMQPAYLPWLGFFDRIAASDVYICLDHVRIDHNTKTTFANRNRIRTPQGWSWLSVPIRTSGRSADLQLNRIEIAGDHWRAKHWRTIEQNYMRATYFRTYQDQFAALFAQPWRMLSDLCEAIVLALLQTFGITTRIVYSSQMDSRSSKAELVLDLCREIGAKAYISGPFGRNYLAASDFSASHIDLYFHDYPHPVYGQAYPGFEYYMSALDLLFNHGPGARKILLRDHSLKSS